MKFLLVLAVVVAVAAAAHSTIQLKKQPTIAQKARNDPRLMDQLVGYKQAMLAAGGEVTFCSFELRM